MAEKEPQFTVRDRRKFTLDGDLRNEDEGTTEDLSGKAATAAAPVEQVVEQQAEQPAAVATEEASPSADGDDGQEAEEIPEPTAAESAQQKKDYHASSRQLDDLVKQANPGAQDTVAMNFDRLVQSIYMTAAMQMGAGADPNEQPRIDILGARQSIDMLGVLEEKTKGNLTEDEKRLLQTALFDLRMSFLDITNAIAKQAQQRPPKPGVIR
jgi:hypothetical protein